MADIDDTETPTTNSPVGERLRAAREEKGLSLEEVASQTRIPLRHLEAIETGDWSRLPAPTYTVGFSKSYASAVGLDRNEIGDQIRDEVGSTRPAVATMNEMSEPIDPARTMPRWLVITAILAIILVVIGLTWLNRQSLQGGDAPAVEAINEAPDAPAQPQVAQAPAVPQGPVVLAATDEVWLQVYERGGRTIFEGVLAAGQRYEIPDSAEDPLLRTGKPEALQVTVGGQSAPPVGPPATTISDVSLRPGELMARGNSAQPAVPAPSAPAGARNTAG